MTKPPPHPGPSPAIKPDPTIVTEIQLLVTALGPTLVAAITGTRDREAPGRWVSGVGPPPAPSERANLRVAADVWTAVATAIGEDAARLFFISANSWLADGGTVIDAIRTGRAADVQAAVAALLDDTWSG